MTGPIVSVSGVRGIVGESFTDDLIRTWAAALATRVGAGTKIVLGRDTRPSGERAITIAAQTLLEQGIQPIVVGITPTPTIQLAVMHHRAAGAMIITASHNPQEWNGLKFLGSDGVFLTAEEMKTLGGLAEHTKEKTADNVQQVAVTTDDHAIQRHIDNVLALPIRAAQIRARKFRVVVDPVNGAGAAAVPQLLRQLGCDVMTINGEPDGQFAHTPEPTPENLTELGKRVAAERADLGVAVDPDADRLVLVDETGTVISEEYTVTLAVMSALTMPHAQWPMAPVVVVNLSTTRMVDDVVKQFGATVVRTPVGERNVVEGMRQHHAIIGGEGSGGVIFPQSHEGRDSLVGCALVLDLLARKGTSLRTLVEMLPQYVMRKEKLPRGKEFDTERFAAQLKHALPDAQIDTRDGIRVDTTDGWVHLRPSNTEPIIRLITEAHTSDALSRLSDVVRNALSHRRS